MKPTIALFIYDPKCSVQCANGMMMALGKYFNFKIFSRDPVESCFFDDVDIVAFPGGIGDADTFHRALRFNKRRVINYVNHGGRYLGICMGAYWAGSHYFDILEGVDAVQYLKRPGTDTRRPHAKNLEITWGRKRMDMFWYDGCAIVGNQSKVKVVARYAANRDPMAVYQGRIGLIGCHPESQPFWYKQYSWMRGLYHEGEHHKLLLDFTSDLMRR